jgi:hypothetical protein
MLPSAIIALFFAVGVSGWTYNKITQRSGGITKSDVTVTAVAGILSFLIAWSIFSLLPGGK